MGKSENHCLISTTRERKEGGKNGNEDGGKGPTNSRLPATAEEIPTFKNLGESPFSRPDWEH